MLNFKLEDTVINENFGGYGGNFWTGCLSDEGKERLGMTEAYFEINAKRILEVRPKFMRIVIMPQYLVDRSDGKNGAENWKNGIYDFETSYMHNFWRYCEVFKAAGTKIELNMGAAASLDILSWFGLPGINDLHGGSRSAPKDLEAFALATASLIKEAHRRGFGDTVKYLNFYNESCHDNYSAYGDKRVYWCNMLKKVHEKLVETDLRDKVVISGADADTHYFLGSAYDSLHKEWLDFIYENAYKKGYCDTMSVHIYYLPEIEGNNERISDAIRAGKYCGQVVNAYKMQKPIMLTEFGRNCIKREGDDGRFSASLAGLALESANNGVSISSFWFFCGTYIPSPICNYQVGALQLWNCPSMGIDGVVSTFGEMGLLMRYIEEGSKVLKITDNDFAHTSAFIKGDETTIAIELDVADSDREINIDLNGRTDKTYYRHTYIYPKDGNMLGDEANAQFDANAVLPRGISVNVSNGHISDTVGKEHCLIIYTTYPSQQQILLENVKLEVSKNETAEIKVKELIGIEADELEYSIIPDGETGKIKGSITGNIYTPDKDAVSGDTVAIRVALKSAFDNERYNLNVNAVSVIEIK